MEHATIGGRQFAIGSVGDVRVMWAAQIDSITGGSPKVCSVFFYRRKKFTPKDTMKISRDAAEFNNIPCYGNNGIRVFTESGFNKLMELMNRQDIIDDCAEYWGINGKKPVLVDKFEDEVIDMAEKIIASRKSTIHLEQTMQEQAKKIELLNTTIKALIEIIREVDGRANWALDAALQLTRSYHE